MLQYTLNILYFRNMWKNRFFETWTGDYILNLIFLILYFSDCNGELPVNWRIRLSLVYISKGVQRIQTAAYLNTDRQICALATEVMKSNVLFYNDLGTMATRTKDSGDSDLKAHNAAWDSVNITSTMKTTDHMIFLGVSRST